MRPPVLWLLAALLPGGTTTPPRTGLHLLVDDAYTQNRSGLEFRQHSPQKVATPALLPDRPWEFSIGSGAVLQVSEGLFYMYYDACGPRGRFVCLATSTDGVSWVVSNPPTPSVDVAPPRRPTPAGPPPGVSSS